MTGGRVRIVSDGTVAGTLVLVDGEPLDAVAVDWYAEAEDAAACAVVELDLVPVELESGEVIWIGLDEVPAEALEQELGRRREL